MEKYASFLLDKEHVGTQDGFSPIFMPNYLFDFQKSLVDWSLKGGRRAIFADCGMGKTPIQLVWAQNIVQKFNKSVLIIAPLSVSQQTIEEAEKFKIKAIRSMNGKFTKLDKIIVTNYERLHYFNPQDFKGVVADECFVGDTKIDIEKGVKNIEDIQVGDKIFNAYGLSKVLVKKKRYHKSLVLTVIQNNIIISSLNHLFFTHRGWIKAKNLREDDYVITTREAMSIMQETFSSEEDGKTRNEKKILWNILFSEMENVSTGNTGKNTYERNAPTNRQEKINLVKNDKGRTKTSKKICHVETYIKSRNKKKNIENTKSYGTQTQDSGRKWKEDAKTTEEAIKEIGKRMGRRIHTKSKGKMDKGVSITLQDRHSESEINGSDRSRWIQSHGRNTKDTRQKEGCKIEGIRVESVEVYEQTNPIFDRYRDKTGRVVLYDLEVENHPSFSVNGLLVHNSSIIKNFDGVRKSEITEFMRKIEYRLLCTATAAPNDYIELGTSSEALGHMGYMDMLSRFFKNDEDSLHPAFFGAQWRFKSHAEEDFWHWMVSWSRACRNPSDLGFNNKTFILKKLIEKEHIIKVPSNGRMGFFIVPSKNWLDQRRDVRESIQQRCELASEKLRDVSSGIAWCHLNKESETLSKMIKGSVEVKGSDSEEKKEESFRAFRHKEIRVLITKPKIAAFGMNWQHCSNMTYFTTHSYEQYYQAIRRCWRFGQKKEVNVHLITTEALIEVMNNMKRKSKACDKMFTKLVEKMNSTLYIDETIKHEKEVELPTWV